MSKSGFFQSRQRVTRDNPDEIDMVGQSAHNTFGKRNFPWRVKPCGITQGKTVELSLSVIIKDISQFSQINVDSFDKFFMRLKTQVLSQLPFQENGAINLHQTLKVVNCKLHISASSCRCVSVGVY